MHSMEIFNIVGRAIKFDVLTDNPNQYNSTSKVS